MATATDTSMQHTELVDDTRVILHVAEHLYSLSLATSHSGFLLMMPQTHLCNHTEIVDDTRVILHVAEHT